MKEAGGEYPGRGNPETWSVLGPAMSCVLTVNFLIWSREQRAIPEGREVSRTRQLRALWAMGGNLDFILNQM